jgi:hypothetical protein
LAAAFFAAPLLTGAAFFAALAGGIFTAALLVVAFIPDGFLCWCRVRRRPFRRYRKKKATLRGGCFLVSY